MEIKMMKKRYYIPILLLIAEAIFTTLFPELREIFNIQPPYIKTIIVSILFSPVWALLCFLSRDSSKPKSIRIICIGFLIFSVLCLVMASIAETNNVANLCINRDVNSSFLSAKAIISPA
jgi:RsiW-degrading membrane proteinase PrsW (M82 family)